ncbi:MarR family winged helix-turn-helix transcriptional regulator [Saccharopolyspora taberi]|uniref:MarR family winged helix-turn-helix transcriptional regulator n=1 Tax=Saccharopolyspora taberi TaxID=60895 RepID=UPI0031D28B0E
MDADLLAGVGGVAEALGRLGRLSSHVDMHAARIGADRASFIMLKRLAADGPLRSNALAEAMHVDPSTISRHVAQLVRDGLVERTVDPVDKRASPLAVTDRGLRWLAEMRRRRDELVSELLRGWSRADREALASLLGRFVDEYEQALPDLLAAMTKHGPYLGPAPETAPRGEN